MGRDKNVSAPHFRQVYLLLLAGKVESDQVTLSLELAYINETVIGDTLHRRIAPNCKSGSRATNLEKCMCQGEHRVGVMALYSDIRLFVVAGDRKPGVDIGRTEASIGTLIPLHWRALWIAAKAQTGEILLPGVLYALRWDFDVVHPNLVTIVECWRTA